MRVLDEDTRVFSFYSSSPLGQTALFLEISPFISDPGSLCLLIQIYTLIHPLSNSIHTHNVYIVRPAIITHLYSLHFHLCQFLCCTYQGILTFLCSFPDDRIYRAINQYSEQIIEAYHHVMSTVGWSDTRMRMVLLGDKASGEIECL